MTLKNLILFPGFLFFLLHSLVAQNINGLEIPVSKDKLSSLTFHSDVTNYFFDDKKSPYRISTLGNNAIMIQISQEVSDPYNLTIMEGGRKHRFILSYKDDIDLADQDKDFSDLKELDKLVKSLNEKSKISKAPETISAPVDQSADNVKRGDKNPDTEKITAVNTADDNFYELVEAADSAKTNGHLQDAKVNYEKALQLKPDNAYAQSQLKEVNKAIAGKSDAKYADLITKANNAFSLARYEEALKSYNDALNIKPGDVYVTSQIALIKKNQEAFKVEEANRQKDNLFTKYIIAGDKAFGEKSYDVAVVAYGEALKIKPDDVIATSKISTVKQKVYTDSIEANRKANDDLYASFLNSGSKALQEKSYEAARMAFEEALKIKHGDAVATEKLNSIGQQIAADSLRLETAKMKTLYEGYIKSANKAFGDNLLDAARSNYSEALKINPDDTYAKSQIKKVDNAIEQNKLQAQKMLEAAESAEREKQYKDLINAADNYYNSGMWAEAKDTYQKALVLNSKDAYSKNKISQIDNIVAQQKQKVRQDSINNVKYTAAVLKADEDFNNKNYATAKASYLNALNYKSDDPYVKDKLLRVQVAMEETAVRDKTIKDSIVKDKEAIKQYNSLMAKADAAYTKDDYVMARGLYVSASELRPDEGAPKNKISEIDTRLNEIALQAQQKATADSLTDIATIALNDSDYTGALENYTKALALSQKEDEYYIKKQISYAQQQIALKDSSVIRAKREEEQQMKVAELKSIFRQAMDSINTKSYAAALTYFNQFINTANNLGFVPQDYDVAKFVSFAQKKIVAINENFKREKTRDTTTRKLPDIKSLPSRIIIVYPHPKDPKLDAIYEKYPDIDFFRPPDDQPFDSISDYGIANMLTSREFMSRQSLSISENSNNGIKLTCENIFFKGAKMYIKLMLQNSTSEEFLTGRMLLTQMNENGKAVLILPNYVAGYPIILSGQQKVIVYVTKTKELSEDDSLHFEVSDRLNKVKIAIDIPGNIYNRELKKRNN